MKRHLIYLVGVSVMLFAACKENKSHTPDHPNNALPADQVTVLSEVDLPESGSEPPSIPNTEEIPISAEERALVEGSNDFAYKLFAQQAQTKRGENLILSPLSWDYALAMVSVGAADDVLADILKAMGWDKGARPDIPAYHKHLTRHMETSSSHQRIFIANSLWIDDNRARNLKPEYPKTLKEYFDAGMSVLDLSRPEAIGHINNWVERKTYGKIKDLLSPNLASDRLVYILANALYFKSPWQSPFDPNMTVDDTFTNAEGKEQTVKMMQSIMLATFVDLPDVQILRIPTEGRGFFVDIILPKDKTAPLTAEFLTKYAPHEVFKKYSRQLDVAVKLPKFKFTTDLLTLVDMNRPKDAEALGLASILRDNAMINMMDNPDLVISKILQKCMVAWDEAGVEAAAATAVVGVEKAVPKPQVEFEVDHPFFFAITHAGSDKLMFVGQVNKI